MAIVKEKFGDVFVHFNTDAEPGTLGYGFLVSHHGGGWMPGVYDSKEAALLGVECCRKDEIRFIKEIATPINHCDFEFRLITTSDMDGF
jgi:hypothetical protein